MKYLFHKKRNIVLMSLFDAAGAFYRIFFPIKKRAIPKDAPRILLMRLDHIGDVLLATAIPKLIKENYPKAHVAFFVGSWAAPLLENNPFVDEVLTFNAPWFSRGVKSEGLAGFFKKGKDLRSRHFDVALGLRGDLRENLWMSYAHIPTRVGFGVTGGGFCLTDQVVYREGLHEEEHLRDLLKPLGIKTETLKPQVYLSEAEISALDGKCKEWGISSDTRWVGFQIGAGTPAKEWPEANIKAFMDLFPKSFPGAGLIFLGSASPKRDEIMPPKGVKYVDLTGKTSLRELLALMKKLSAFIGPDSGPTHIAAAMGVPTVFIYSGTNDFKRWRPLSEEAAVLRHEVACSPCELEICKVNGHPCLSKISPETVLTALNEKMR